MIISIKINYFQKSGYLSPTKDSKSLWYALVEEKTLYFFWIPIYKSETVINKQGSINT